MSEETPADLRQALEAAQAELKKVQKTNEKLLSENRQLMAEQVFKEAGLPEKAVSLYLAVNQDADISVEAVKSFADEYGLGSEAQPAEGAESSAPAEPVETQGLEHIARAGTREGGVGQPPASEKLLTRTEFLVLQQEDPAAAALALAEGRVQLRNDNPLAVGGATMTPGANPFRPSESSEAQS